MYNFRDVNSASGGYTLPSEALSINGIFIENLLPGYRTLNVSGREALTAELNTFETGNRDGSTLKNKRYPARIITVKYQIIANDNATFRTYYNKLAAILNVQEARLIFNDEPDKFFIGTPSSIGEVEPGRNAVVGAFELYCADPFKYSVREFEASPDTTTKSFLINYNGTYKAFPKLQATIPELHDSSTNVCECGYVAFYNEEEKIIQLGDPDEADTATFPKNQLLIEKKFPDMNSFDPSEAINWSSGDGKVFDSSQEQTGSVAMTAASYASSTQPKTEGQLIKCVSRLQNPNIEYVVSAKTSNRTANAIDVSVTFTMSTLSAHNTGYIELTGYIKFGSGGWNSVILKSADETWKGEFSFVRNLTVTVGTSSANADVLTGIQFKVERTDGTNNNVGIVSETPCNDLPISPYGAPVANSYYLKPDSFGSGSGWHGPSITRTIPADSSGHVGASNFEFSYCQKISIGENSVDTQEIGGFQAYVVSGSGASRSIIAGVSIMKKASGKTASINFYVNNRSVYSSEIDLSFNNKYFGNNNPSMGIESVKTSYITKTGKKVEFNIGGIKYTHSDTAIQNVEAKEITFYFPKYKDKSELSWNGLYWLKFNKINCTTWADIPNKFSSSDVVVADCKSGEVLLNGSPMPELGALGNDWDEFYLRPGLNVIGYSYSDWVRGFYAPYFKIKYREVFI